MPLTFPEALAFTAILASEPGPNQARAAELLREARAAGYAVPDGQEGVELAVSAWVKGRRARARTKWARTLGRRSGAAR